ncbi:MAG: DegV family protein [Chloroflexi bacterium]|nr:MAG: DegV family protein [Chloroflexota bacterium]
MVKIIADTTSGLPAEVARRYNIPIIPQIINFGDQSFIENVNIDNAGFMQRLKTCKELPKTAAPAPEWFVQEFEKLVPLGEPIICIHPSSVVSGTVRAALVAAKDFPNADIRVIDTQMVANPLATMVELAAKWAEAGADADTIESRIKDMIPRARLFALVDTLEFLSRGGRIGGAAALLGTVLQVKPIITLREGKVDQFDKERTHRRAVARLKELVHTMYPNNGDGYLGILHAAVPEEAKLLANELGRELGLDVVPVLDVPPAIATHAGPGLLGVSFFVKE